MKSLIYIKTFLVLMLSAILLMSFNDATHPMSDEISAFAIKPDLRVSKISTPGGLCAGIKNKVRVTITNSQMAGVKKKIPVILFVQQNGQPTTSYVGHSTSGIGPNANSGIPVYFNNVVVASTGNLTLRAVVNPDQELLESVYNNNSRVQRARVTRNCNAAKPPVNGKKLTVTAYVDGSWSAGNYNPVAGATVKVKKGSTTIATGTTGSNGKVQFPNVPKGLVNIIVSKGNNCVEPSNYMMPAYDAKVNRVSFCN